LPSCVIYCYASCVDAWYRKNEDGHGGVWAVHPTNLWLRRLVTDFYTPPGISEAGCARLLKVPMKWNFRLLFYSKILKSMILWFVIFEFGFRASANEFFLQLRRWPIWVKMCEIPRGQNMQISTVDVIRCVKEGVGSFSLPESLFLRATKHHLHGRHCLVYISEEQSQKSSLLASCSDIRLNCKATNASVLCSLHFEQSCYRRLLNSRDPLQRRCLK